MKKVDIYFNQEFVKQVNCNKIQKDPDTNCNYLFIDDPDRPNFDLLVCIVPYNYMIIVVR